MTVEKHRYFIVNKPYQMLSQFICFDPRRRILSDLDYKFPEGIHAIGRLDFLSEGLLIVTTNKRVTRLLLHRAPRHQRTYLVKVMRPVSPEELQGLRTGVRIQVQGGEYWTTSPCEVDIVEKPEGFFPRPFERKEYTPPTWIRFTLTEGKYRQIRKMVKSIRQSCIRLVRISVEDLELGDLAPGCVREFEEAEFFRLLKIRDWAEPLPRWEPARIEESED